MGAKDYILVRCTGGDVGAILSEGQPLDRDGSAKLAQRLYPSSRLRGIGDGNLWSNANPPDHVLYVGCYPEVEIVCSLDLAVDAPSRLDRKYVSNDGETYVHCMNSAIDWCAFALWRDGVLVRSLSVRPERGWIENVGQRLDFELPFWDGQHPVDAFVDEGRLIEYPLPFHPLELAEEALRSFFGFVYEGVPIADPVDPRSVGLVGYVIDG